MTSQKVRARDVLCGIDADHRMIVCADCDDEADNPWCENCFSSLCAMCDSCPDCGELDCICDDDGEVHN